MCILLNCFLLRVCVCCKLLFWFAVWTGLPFVLCQKDMEVERLFNEDVWDLSSRCEILVRQMGWCQYIKNGRTMFIEHSPGRRIKLQALMWKEQYSIACWFLIYVQSAWRYLIFDLIVRPLECFSRPTIRGSKNIVLSSLIKQIVMKLTLIPTLSGLMIVALRQQSLCGQTV